MQVLFKFAAMGILAEEGAFLRNGWNQVDFFVVFVGWLPYAFRVFAENGNLTGLRAIRALRPLRTLTHVSTLVSVPRPLGYFALPASHRLPCQRLPC